MVQMALEEVTFNGLIDEEKKEDGNYSYCEELPTHSSLDIKPASSFSSDEQNIKIDDTEHKLDNPPNYGNVLAGPKSPDQLERFKETKENSLIMVKTPNVLDQTLINDLLNESNEFFRDVPNINFTDNSPDTSSPSDCSNVSSPPRWSCDCSLNVTSRNMKVSSDEKPSPSDSSSRTNSIDTDNHDDEEEEKGQVEENEGCFNHRHYIATLRELELSKATISELQDKLRDLENHVSEEVSYAERVALLEQKVQQQEKELELSRQEHDLDSRTLAALRRETDTKIDMLKKQYEQANKEKESMVMRYANSEKEVIDQKKEKEVMDRKLKESLKENENLSGKLKIAMSEKVRIAQLLDNKSSDLSSASKEMERLKEEINARDIKIKWIQNKVKTEIDLHKACPKKIEDLTSKICQLEDELDKAKKEQEIQAKEILECQQYKSLEFQLKEEQAKMILERHENVERETKMKLLQSKNSTLIEENNNLSLQVQNLEQERFENEQKLSKAREEVRHYSSLVADLQAKLVDIDSLSSQLQQAKEKAEAVSCEIERLRKSNEELVSDMAACRKREAEMLAFTQKLTTKNVQLQSEFSTVEAKATHLETEHQIAEEAMVDLRKRVLSLEKELKSERSRREEERRLLVREAAEKAARAEALGEDLEYQKGEISVLRTKHAATIKEMQRELHQYRKKLESLESGNSGGGGSLGQGSRTSSLGSLSETQSQPPTTNYHVEVSQQALVDRIVRLQHEIARQKERIEFLEDHSSQLTKEMQKKTRLLQSYILREEAGALTSRSMDSNKAEVAKHGGIMASVYASKPSDGTMTLELSLEINHKLQAILEDTLLKNITLKENLDTLGDEIARLSKRKS